MSTAVQVNGQSMTFGDVIAVAREDATLTLGPQAIANMERTRAHVEAAALSDDPVYGITTGFGGLASVLIPASQRAEMQHAILRSHAAGMGPSIEKEIVRALLLLRIATLARGYSGIRPLVVQHIVDVLNAGITPHVPAFGSLGASGDLAPLSHACLCLIGEGEVVTADGARTAAGPVLAAAGIMPLSLEPKEGLALINSTDGMLGMLVLACSDALRLFRTADVIAAMSIEGLLGTDRPFAADLQALRHVLPNVIPSVIVLATLELGSLMLAISGLSFLGLGAQPPTPEWGTMLSDGRLFFLNAPQLMMYPGIAITLVVLGCNLLGDGLRDALDPRDRVR